MLFGCLAGLTEQIQMSTGILILPHWWRLNSLSHQAEGAYRLNSIPERFLAALGYRDFRTLWMASLCAGAAACDTWALIVARGWLAFAITDTNSSRFALPPVERNSYHLPTLYVLVEGVLGFIPQPKRPRRMGGAIMK